MPSGGARRGSGPKSAEIQERRRELERLWYDDISDADHLAIIRQVKRLAKRGTQWAVVLYFERIQGKVAQPLEHSGDPAKPIHVRHSDRSSAQR